VCDPTESSATGYWLLATSFVEGKSVFMREAVLRAVFTGGGCPCARRAGSDRASKEKGIWWMPWRQEAMKDVARCEKPGLGASDR